MENNTILKSKNGTDRIISNNGSPLMDLDGNVLGGSVDVVAVCGREAG